MSKMWWADRKLGNLATWYTLDPKEMNSTAEGSTLTALEDGTILAGGRRPLTDTYVYTAKMALQTLTAIRLDVLPHESLPMKGPGRAGNGNFHLNEFECELLPPDDKEVVKLTLGSATADFEQAGPWNVAAALDGKPRTAWAIHPKVGQPHHTHLHLD